VHEAVILRYPFLTLSQAAHFLGVSFEAAQRMYDVDELPKALRLDGGLFEPTPGITLIPYLEFKAQSALHVGLELERWQRGEVQLPIRGVPSAGRPLTLIPSVSASEEVEKV
jgi:hypothetical protein